MTTQKITIYHSPDADDAFMFYGLTSGAVSYPGYEFDHKLCDIETLNQRALKGELDVTAISVHAYPYVSDNYTMLSCGASMGEKDYGPRLITKEGKSITDVKKIATPGVMTSAKLGLSIYMMENNITAEMTDINFDEITDAVLSGTFDAGLIIHEDQITHQRKGLNTIVDLGVWFWNENKLPMPLGINIVNERLGAEGMKAVRHVLHGSIEYSLKHRSEALDYALSYGRGLSKEDADEFVGMYVNERTLDLGEEGKKAIQVFLDKGRKSGLINRDFKIKFL